MGSEGIARASRPGRRRADGTKRNEGRRLSYCVSFVRLTTESEGFRCLRAERRSVGAWEVTGDYSEASFIGLKSAIGRLQFHARQTDERRWTGGDGLVANWNFLGAEIEIENSGMKTFDLSFPLTKTI